MKGTRDQTLAKCVRAKGQFTISEEAHRAERMTSASGKPPAFILQHQCEGADVQQSSGGL